MSNYFKTVHSYRLVLNEKFGCGFLELRFYAKPSQMERLAGRCVNLYGSKYEVYVHTICEGRTALTMKHTEILDVLERVYDLS